MTKEASLAASEAELQKLAREDVGLSQKVIDLRKEVDRSRKAVRTMHEERQRSRELVDGLMKELQTCETEEKRRHEVALETEKSLGEAKGALDQMKGEIHLAEARRRDAELVCYGLQQQVHLLERELGGLRQQVAHGNLTIGQKMTDAFGRLGSRGQNATSHEGLHLINSEMT